MPLRWVGRRRVDRVCRRGARDFRRRARTLCFPQCTFANLRPLCEQSLAFQSLGERHLSSVGPRPAPRAHPPAAMLLCSSLRSAAPRPLAARARARRCVSARAQLWDSEPAALATELFPLSAERRLAREVVEELLECTVASVPELIWLLKKFPPLNTLSESQGPKWMDALLRSFSETFEVDDPVYGPNMFCLTPAAAEERRLLPSRADWLRAHALLLSSGEHTRLGEAAVQLLLLRDERRSVDDVAMQLHSRFYSALAFKDRDACSVWVLRSFPATFELSKEDGACEMVCLTQAAKLARGLVIAVDTVEQQQQLQRSELLMALKALAVEAVFQCEQNGSSTDLGALLHPNAKLSHVVAFQSAFAEFRQHFKKVPDFFNLFPETFILNNQIVTLQPEVLGGRKVSNDDTVEEFSTVGIQVADPVIALRDALVALLLKEKGHTARLGTSVFQPFKSMRAKLGKKAAAPAKLEDFLRSFPDSFIVEGSEHGLRATL